MRYVILLLLTASAQAAVLSNNQISCTITQKGIESISLGGRVVTTQPSQDVMKRQGFYSSTAYPPAPGTAIAGQVLHSTLTSTPAAVTVTEVRSNMTVAYTYSLTGSDIDMGAVLRNNDPQPFSNIMIALPTFALGDHATGNMKSFDRGYLVSNPQDAFHPGTWSPIAVSYARNENFGVALHCKSHFDKPSIFSAYLPGKNPWTPPAIADMTLYLHDRVEPGNQLVVDVTIHLTEKTDLPSLLSSYIADFQKAFGPMQYAADDRPWLQFSAFDASFVTPENPLGYNGENRRFDTPIGIFKFENMVRPSIGVTQGTIFWQPQGYNPRGCGYRPDFDVWPPRVSANLPSLIKWYNDHGLKFGLCARPADIVTPDGPGTDQVCQLDGENASQMAMLLARFDHAAKLGVSAYYLDSFGADLNSYHIMKQLRAHLGNSIPTYSEFTSDLMLPYCGMYAELSPHGAPNGGPDGSTTWYDRDTLTAFRLLYPNSTILATHLGAATGQPMVTPAQLAGWKMTPMAGDFEAGQYAPFFRDLITNQMSGNVWK